MTTEKTKCANDRMKSIAKYLKPWMDLSEEERVIYCREDMKFSGSSCNIFSPLPGVWPKHKRNEFFKEEDENI